MEIKSPDSCQFDILSLGEIMLRLDPGNGRIRTARNFRSVFLGNIRDAFDKNRSMTNLLLDPFFEKAVWNAQTSWRRVVATAVTVGIPMPAISAALAYFDRYRTKQLPANLLQAQRDYFGAHTYERADKSGGEFFHTNWPGRGGTTSSTTYNA